jgi:hypothetical protein
MMRRELSPLNLVSNSEVARVFKKVGRHVVERVIYDIHADGVYFGRYQLMATVLQTG